MKPGDITKPIRAEIKREKTRKATLWDLTVGVNYKEGYLAGLRKAIKIIYNIETKALKG